MKRLMYLGLLVIVSACAVAEKVDPLKELSVNRGTNTAVIKVSLGDDGMPSIDTDPLVIKEGQRVVWVGPAEMDIRFPKTTPFSKGNLPTRNAVINMKIPKQKKWGEKEEYKKFKYDVVVGKKVLDPVIIIRRGF